MKNLVLLGEHHFCIDDVATNQSNKDPSSDAVRDIVDVCEVPDATEDGEVNKIVLRRDGMLSCISPSDNTIVWTCNLNEVRDDDDDDKDDDDDNDGDKDANDVPAKANNDWFNLTHVDPDVVCLSQTGAIVTVSTATGSAELVGVFDEGIEAAAWSPDREQLLLVSHTTETDDDIDDDDGAMNEGNTDNEGSPDTQQGTGAEVRNTVLISMNAQWEVLAEVSIDRIMTSPLPPPATSTSTDAHVNDNVNVNDKDERAYVTWRPDGSYCSVSAVDEADKVRKLRIYKPSTLELHAIGRSEDGAGKVIKNISSIQTGWAGAGCSHLLTTVQRKGKNTIQVIFFESNGLRHREFTLRDPGLVTTLFGLAWNVNSDLLAVSLRNNSENEDKVQLWHRSNYHWYMKQELRYPINTVARVKFDEERPWKLLTFMKSNRWVEYEVRWDPGITQTTEKGCTALVVDGCKLQVTPFHKALVPPPMSFSHIDFDAPIRHVSCITHQTVSHMALVLLSNGDLALCNKKCLRSFGAAADAIETIEWDAESTTTIPVKSLRMVTVVGAENGNIQFVAAMCAAGGSATEVLMEGNVLVEADAVKATITKQFRLESKVLRIANWSDTADGALVELVDGTLVEYERNNGEGSVVPSPSDPLLEVCPWIAGVKNMSDHHASAADADPHFDGFHQSRLIFGRSAKSRLYSGDLLLSDSSSSFVLSMAHEYLCFVVSGSRCQVRFIPLSEVVSFDPLMGSDQNQLLLGYEPRNVERGSVIVGVLPASPTAVLQLPRGNLEGIDPRALVLRSCMKYIETNRFAAAFKVMRRQKVDLNLIVDYDPRKFLAEGMPMFLEQVKKIDHLNLFISSLQDFNVTDFRYPVPPWIRSNEKMQKSGDAGTGQDAFDFTTKINQICDTARSIMMKFESQGATDAGTNVDEGHFLLPILSTFAKQNPPKLEEALALIRTNALNNYKPDSKKPALFAEKAQGSIHYLAFLAEYELLFETALGMYDLELARAVARNSQMDPKKYLPLLKRLKALPESYGRYEIDVRLKRYDLALTHLAASYVKRESFDSGDNEASSLQISALLNSFDDCMRLVEEHALHSTALSLFGKDADNRRRIMISLGEHLLTESKAKTALTVFSSVHPDFRDGAMRAARACRDWRSYFSLVQQQQQQERQEQQEGQEGHLSEEVNKANLGMMAREVAEEITGDIMGGSAVSTKQQSYADAASILLDYAEDVVGAVDMLIDGELWQEAQRTALRFSRNDLARRCIESAEDFAHSTISDLDARCKQYTKANERFGEVVTIRKRAAVDDAPQPEMDETGSLFSAASNRSNMSLRSTTSNTSMGSAISVSSVISVKSNTNFSMTGTEEANRHRSKFNRGKKQKKQRKKKNKRIQRGSEEELQSLTIELRSTWVDAQYAKVISDTVLFLLRSDHHDLAETLFGTFQKACEVMDKVRIERIEAVQTAKKESEIKARKEGGMFEEQYFQVEIPAEKEMDSMVVSKLDASVMDFFVLVQQS